MDCMDTHMQAPQRVLACWMKCMDGSTALLGEQTSGARYLHALGKAVRLDTRDALELVDHAHMVTQRALHNVLRSVHLPAPLTAHCAHTMPFTAYTLEGMCGP